MDSTKRSIIEAAERLFAEHGIGGVSLRQINVAAGQKNASATHYHFGSKTALINAIFGYRLPHAAIMRENMLRIARDSPAELRSRRLVEAFVLPFAEHLLDPDKSDNFIRFMAAFRSDLSLDWDEIEAPDYTEVLKETTEMARELHPTESARSLKQRMAIIQSFWLNGVADLARYNQRRARRGLEVDLESAVNHLIILLEGALLQPMEAGRPAPPNPSASPQRAVDGDDDGAN